MHITPCDLGSFDVFLCYLRVPPVPNIYNFLLDDLLYSRPEVDSLVEVELECDGFTLSTVDEPALEAGGAYFPKYLA